MTDISVALTKRIAELKVENERLRAVSEAAQRLYCGGVYQEDNDYFLISGASLDALDDALDALEEE